MTSQGLIEPLLTDGLSVSPLRTHGLSVIPQRVSIGLTCGQGGRLHTGNRPCSTPQDPFDAEVGLEEGCLLVHNKVLCLA